MKMKVNRRDFIKAVAVSVAPGCGIETNRAIPEEHEKTLADKLFDDFPEKLPYSYSVNKYRISGAKQCLVHVIQRHDIDPGMAGFEDPVERLVFLSKPSTRADIAQVNKCQEDIYRIISLLKGMYSLEGIFHEGITPESIPRMENKKIFEKFITYIDEPLEFEISCLKRELDSSPVSLSLDYTEKLFKLEEKQKKFEEMKKTHKYYRGGGLRLCYEGEIEVYPTETAEGLKKARAERKKTLFRNPKIYLDDREDIVLDHASRINEPLAVLVFGAAHALGGKKSCGEDYELWWRESYKDNIYEWNKTHPDKRFSLIEIIPENYSKRDDD